jgi:hypothetical protein
MDEQQTMPTNAESLSHILVHNCLVEADMKTLFMKNVAFPCTRAFGDACTNDEVYSEAVSPLVEAALAGRIATVFMYGQVE